MLFLLEAAIAINDIWCYDDLVSAPRAGEAINSMRQFTRKEESINEIDRPGMFCTAKSELILNVSLGSI